MGVLLTAACPSCGFESGALNGGSGMLQRRAFAPALAGDRLVMAAVEQRPRGWRHYHSHPELGRGPELGEPVLAWGTETGGLIRLADRRFRCPSCDLFAMRFAAIGWWD